MACVCDASSNKFLASTLCKISNAVIVEVTKRRANDRFWSKLSFFPSQNISRRHARLVLRIFLPRYSDEYRKSRESYSCNNVFFFARAYANSRSARYGVSGIQIELYNNSTVQVMQNESLPRYSFRRRRKTLITFALKIYNCRNECARARAMLRGLRKIQMQHNCLLRHVGEFPVNWSSSEIDRETDRSKKRSRCFFIRRFVKKKKKKNSIKLAARLKMRINKPDEDESWEEGDPQSSLLMSLIERHTGSTLRDQKPSSVASPPRRRRLVNRREMHDCDYARSTKSFR